jgi:DNA-binding CsgD family transcriptional regulator
MFDMRTLPAAAAELSGLSEADRTMLGDVAAGLSPREIAERHQVNEDRLYRLVAWVLDELAPAPNGDTMHDVHARNASHPAGPADIEEFERRFGPSMAPDDEG